MLTRNILHRISANKQVTVPAEAMFVLPEKVLQFGTGVLLRGLPDYYIDKANRQGIFNGRIVVVKSTGSGEFSAFGKQDGLYTVCIRGIADGKKVEENIINASISRVLSATDDWQQVLQCAHNADMKLIISNTTEVGIRLTDDNIRLSPPDSYPGKLLAFLYERFNAFNGSADSGMIIIPTELLTDNAKKLQSIVEELARLNHLEESFLTWLANANTFCNSLVDRIVPGMPPPHERSSLKQQLSYEDDLLLVAEAYSLWAIEADSQKVKDALSFSQADDGVIIAPDITRFRELKLRLLNGTHTLSCGLALLAGFTTVKEAMEDHDFAAWMYNMMEHDIIPAMVDDSISEAEARRFAQKVLDRFRNPYLEHKWISISAQYTTKLKMRNLPLLMRFYERFNRVPEFMALGFAGYLLLMNVKASGTGGYKGAINGLEYQLQDDQASLFSEKWSRYSDEALVEGVLKDVSLWDSDLTRLNGFSSAVAGKMESLTKDGARKCIQQMLNDKMVIES